MEEIMILVKIEKDIFKFLLLKRIGINNKYTEIENI